ncbi:MULTISPECIES: TlpA disulfide reductase family protein [unclassified Beijerinckia]|uniref:thiol:disulfide interchange protein TlpA n=1 Tax=unclassified Beijerinckia TaxID=2638183 RepID=UPI0008966045|nr:MULTISPECIES: TlpA disulfide reductase family protein [unclassified Beijerinckia]MDH7798074.1 thiol-disulfide isomerase/thioredoxin [Beijerinckia sp. GAS462]SED08104.1 Thiol-disulfide isomerase or thioredoxin [Beijerinckia sp. 28-YEA-48]
MADEAEKKISGGAAGKPGVPRGTLVLAGVAAVAIAAVVYGIIAVGGKETATGNCAVTEAGLAPLRAAATGDVAGLTVNKLVKPATEISFDGADGQRKTLADFKGKTVLLNLWATWCLPCRAEMPALDQLQAKLGGANFEVVAVNIDTARLEKRQAFLDEAGVKSLAFYADPKAGVFQTLRQAGKVVGLPTTLLIDSRGCELGVMSGPAEWASEDALRLIRAATALKPAT